MRWRDDKKYEEEHTITSLGILNLNEDPDPVSPTSHLHKALDACLSMACTNDLTSRRTKLNILTMLTQLSPGDTNLDASIRTALSIHPYNPGLAQEELDRIPNAVSSLVKALASTIVVWVNSTARLKCESDISVPFQRDAEEGVKTPTPCISYLKPRPATDASNS